FAFCGCLYPCLFSFSFQLAIQFYPLLLAQPIFVFAYESILVYLSFSLLLLLEFPTFWFLFYRIVSWPTVFEPLSLLQQAFLSWAFPSSWISFQDVFWC